MGRFITVAAAIAACSSLLSCETARPTADEGCRTNRECQIGTLCDPVDNACYIEDGSLFAGAFSCEVDGNLAQSSAAVMGRFENMRIPLTFSTACTSRDDGTVSILISAAGGFNGNVESFAGLSFRVGRGAHGRQIVGTNTEAREILVLMLFQPDELTEVDAIAGGFDGYVLLDQPVLPGTKLTGYILAQMAPL